MDGINWAWTSFKELLNPRETPNSPKKPPPRKVVNREPKPSSSMMYRDVRISLGQADDPEMVSAGLQSDPDPLAKEVPDSDLYHGMDLALLRKGSLIIHRLGLRLHRLAYPDISTC